MKKITLADIAGLLLLAGMAAGCSGLSGYERVFVTQPAVPGAFTVVRAPCPAGKKVLGGGYQYTGSKGDVEVGQSFPQQASNDVFAWQVGVFNSGPAASNVTAWAACAQ